MIIRKASKKNLPAILKLIGEHPEQLMQHHLPKTSEFLLAILDENIVGCCALEIYSKRLAEIRSLAVNKNFQGRGIATELVKSCLELAKKKKVYEVISITSASKLFEKHGFGTFKNEKYALIKILEN